jgi:hypothetical protein
MKRLSVVVVLLLMGFSMLTYSQVTEAEKKLRALTADSTQGWKTGGMINISLAQTSLTNWASGGQNSFAVNGLFSVFANLKKGKSRWDNSLDVGYGLLKQGKESSFRKTDDKFDFLSKYGREAFKDFFYAGLINLKTQMAPGYNYPDDSTQISNWFAPGYLLLAFGMDYKPNAYFSAFISPLTGKLTFVNDRTLSDAGAFGVTPGKKMMSEFGGYVRVIYSKSDFKREILKSVSFTTKVDLFTNYLKNPQNIVVNWENLIGFKVNKFISVSITTDLIYDDKIMIPFDKNSDGIIAAGEAVGSRVQFKEILGVGFAYKF